MVVVERVVSGGGIEVNELTNRARDVSGSAI